MDAYSSAISALTTSLGLVVLGMFAIYFVLLFVLGLMFYYFTGNNKPGESLLSGLMGVGARLYAHSWMLLSSLLFLSGLTSLFRAVIGGLFPEFTYGTSSALLGRSVNPGQADLASGLALTVVAALIFAVHFGMDYMIDKRLNLKNPLMHKIFNTFGLFTSGFILFGSLITFVIALASSSASSLSRPGATLAVVLAAVPVWVYYLVQSMMAMRRER